jgi:hypothetical protein
LSDDDGTGTDDEDGVNRGVFGHGWVLGRASQKNKLRKATGKA